MGKIAILDFGSLYINYIVKKCIMWNVEYDIYLPEVVTAEELKNYSGIIYSGSPFSVYENKSPQSDVEILELGIPIFGICYGHQLIMRQLGANVAPISGDKLKNPTLKNYNITIRKYIKNYNRSIEDFFVYENVGIFETHKEFDVTNVYMSHGDEVKEIPDGFMHLGSTAVCRYAATANYDKKIFTVQFHPEIVGTSNGTHYFERFFEICGLEVQYRKLSEMKDIVPNYVPNNMLTYPAASGNYYDDDSDYIVKLLCG